MSRSKLREKVFQLVFRVAFNDEEELSQQAEFFFEDEQQEGLTEKEQKQIQDKFDRIVEKLEEIDQLINENFKEL